MLHRTVSEFDLFILDKFWYLHLETLKGLESGLFYCINIVLKAY